VVAGETITTNQATKTGDGQVTITYDPTTDGCGNAPPAPGAPTPVVAAWRTPVRKDLRLVHTWDLARAIGLDETLNPEVVR
jgi:hypothetical protein